MMKRVLTIVLMSLLLFSCDTARNLTPEEVPSPVREAFTAAYPKAEDVAWAQVGEDYQVTFYIEGARMEVEYDVHGTLIEVETL